MLTQSLSSTETTASQNCLYMTLKVERPTPKRFATVQSSADEHSLYRPIATRFSESIGSRMLVLCRSRAHGASSPR